MSSSLDKRHARYALYWPEEVVDAGEDADELRAGVVRTLTNDLQSKCWPLIPPLLKC